MTSVTFRYVSSLKCDEKPKQVGGQQTEVKAVKGTMKIHAVVGVGNFVIKVREVSCYCPQCLTEDICENWRQESTKKADDHPEESMIAAPSHSENENTVQVVSRSDQNVKYQAGDFMAARYDDKLYIGKIVDCGEYESEYEISSMENKKSLYQWPAKTDCIWIKEHDVFRKLDEPTATGKSSRLFRLSQLGEAKLAPFGE